MKRSTAIIQEFIIDTAEAVLELTQDEVGLVALEITLLMSAMISQVTLRSPTNQRIELTVNPNEHTTRAKLRLIAPEQLQVELPRNQGEFLQAVLLRAYRDEMAEVNHIHLEGFMNGEPMDLTFLFRVYREPMSQKDAVKALGD